MKRTYRIIKLWIFDRIKLAKKLKFYNEVYNRVLTLDQKLHNKSVEESIRQRDTEYENYIADCNNKREQFKIDNPNHPFADSMFMPVRSKKQIIAIKYVTG